MTTYVYGATKRPDHVCSCGHVHRKRGTSRRRVVALNRYSVLQAVTANA